jgi:capsular polysaccharide biosynthesis protein
MNNYNQANNFDPKKAKEINLKELYLVIKRRFWIIALLTILAISFGAYQSLKEKPIPLYQSSARIIIGADEESRKTLQVIIRDSTILDKVIKELNLHISAEILAGRIIVASVESSQVVSIAAIDQDPVLAAHIADTTARIFKEEIPNIVGQDYIRILSKAKVSQVPINQGNNNLIYILIVAALVMGIGLAFLLESLDDKIRAEDDIESMLGITVLGKVSKMNRRNLKEKSNFKQVDVELRGESIEYK